MKLHNTIIGGLPGSGKTLMMLHLAALVSSQWYKVGFIHSDSTDQYLRNAQNLLDYELKDVKFLRVGFENAKDLNPNGIPEFDYIFIDDSFVFDDQKRSEIIERLIYNDVIVVFSCQLPAGVYNANTDAKYRALKLLYPGLDFDRFVVEKNKLAMQIVLLEDDKVIETLSLDRWEHLRWICATSFGFDVKLKDGDRYLLKYKL